MVRAVCILLGLMLCCSAALAQDATPAITDRACSDAGRSNLAAKLLTAATALSNNTADQQTLLIAQAVLATYRADCADLKFTSQEYGANVVTDPIVFSDGLYRQTIESSGDTTVMLTAVSGLCGGTYNYTPSSGGKRETTALMKACVAVLEINGDAEWALTYTPIVTAAK